MVEGATMTMRSGLIRLAKWLRGEEESPLESLLGDSGIAVRCPRQVRAVVAARPPSGNLFAHPAAARTVRHTSA